MYTCMLTSTRPNRIIKRTTWLPMSAMGVWGGGGGVQEVVCKQLLRLVCGVRVVVMRWLENLNNLSWTPVKSSGAMLCYAVQCAVAAVPLRAAAAGWLAAGDRAPDPAHTVGGLPEGIFIHTYLPPCDHAAAAAQAAVTETAEAAITAVPTTAVAVAAQARTADPRCYVTP